MEEQKGTYTFEVEDSNGRPYVLSAAGPGVKLGDLIDCVMRDPPTGKKNFSGPAFWYAVEKGLTFSDEILELAAAGKTVGALGRRYTGETEVPHIVPLWNPNRCRFCRDEYRKPAAVRWKI